ncbi:hypothetical protein ACFL4T_00580 [candidate division KSB1 bacterium]
MRKNLYLNITLIFAVVLFGLLSNCSYTEPEQPIQVADLDLSFTSDPGTAVDILEGGVVTFQWKAVGGMGDVFYDYTVTDITTAASPVVIDEATGTVITSIQVTPTDAHTYEVEVTATDDDDDTDTETITFTATVTAVATTPTVTITKPGSNWKYASGQGVIFAWTGSDPNGEAVTFSYKIDAGTYSDYDTRSNIGITGILDGDHTFYVKVKNSEGVETTASVDFTLMPANILVFNEITTYGTGAEEFSVAQAVDFETTWKKNLEGFAVKVHSYWDDGELTDADFVGVDILLWLGSDYHNNYGWNVGYLWEIGLFEEGVNPLESSYADDLDHLAAVTEFLDAGGKIIYNDPYGIAEWAYYAYIGAITVTDSSVTPVTTTTINGWWAEYLHLEPDYWTHWVIPPVGDRYEESDEDGDGYWDYWAVKDAVSKYPNLYPTLTADAVKPGVVNFQSPHVEVTDPGTGAAAIYHRTSGSPAEPSPTDYIMITYPDASTGLANLESAWVSFPIWQFNGDGQRAFMIQILKQMGESW